MMETDVLIIGAGAAGLTAALAASEAGARVTVIEKGERLGGTAAISGGIVWVANNPAMQALGLADSREEALAYFRSLNHGEMQDEVLEAFIDSGPHALAFLHELGAAELSVVPGYPDYYLDRPGAKPGGGRALDNELFDFNLLGDWAAKVYNGGDVQRLMLRETPLGGGTGYTDPKVMQERVAADLRGWGQALIGRLLKACLDRGIEPVLGTQAKRLLIEDGRIAGAEVTGNEGSYTITAKRGVVLATGGFEWDAKLKSAFLRGPMPAPASPPINTGDGLKMAMAVGADLGNMTSAWWMPTLSIPGARWPDNGGVGGEGERRSMPVLIERTLPHTILVNRSGKRFCNEANNYASLAGAFHVFDPERYGYPNMPAYLILDQQYMSRYPLAGHMPGQPVPDWIISADTLPELAAKTGVDAAQLAATVAAFNTHAENAEDPEFGRGRSPYDSFYGDRSRPGAAATLGSIDTAPYYAVEISLGALGTHGGPRTNGKAQVLDVSGQAIAGLYGAGNVIACPTGTVYAGAGGTLGPALTLGYIAGQSAARLENAL